MKLLDTDIINYILVNNTSLSDEYFITPDIEQEVFIAEIVHSRKAPKNIRTILTQGDFDEALYIKNYFSALNQYGKRSFFNMKGFGDVSMIALVKTLVEINNTKPQALPLPGLSRDIEVYTGDNNLKKALQKEFSSNDVKVLSKTDI